MFLLPNEFSHLSKLMDVSELRQRVISQNLANVNTPGFQRKEVVFEDVLAEHLENGRKVPETLQAQVIDEQGLVSRADGNNVDVDREIVELNRNSMLFKTYSQLLGSQFDQMRRAMR